MSAPTGPPDLDPLRSKLVQLIDTISTLQDQLHYLSLSTPEPSTSNPGLLPWPELLGRYNLLLSHIVGLGGLLNSVGATATGAGAGGQGRREKWESLLVVPRVKVDESNDWLVGMLLRTKQVRPPTSLPPLPLTITNTVNEQTPEIESHLESLLMSLPGGFTDPETHEDAVRAHERRVERAGESVARLKEGRRGEEWEWKGRVEVDEDDDDEEEEEEDGHRQGHGGGESGILGMEVDLMAEDEED